ncbi:MAG: BtrH N-terminal domain-containing protein [Clostridiales bacterium]|nr:BtrH N-terminal domain-containing protein [Clostridiales bacterium]
MYSVKTKIGEHCETTATGTLLLNLGVELSEPMLFGLGEGLGFGVINFGKMPFPFLGGRTKTGLITEKLCENLNLELIQCRTTSVKKAWSNIKGELDNGIPVGLQLDSYYLDYFTTKVHFAGHYVAIIGYDETHAFLVDTLQQGGVVSTSLESLADARNAKGPMSDKNMSYTIKLKGDYDLKDALIKALKNNAVEFLNPPIRNFGYKGIIKASQELSKWFHESSNPENDFKTMAMLMEKAGTGGSIFRNIYRDFLYEAYGILKLEPILEAHKQFLESAKLWSKVINLFEETGETEDEKYLEEASIILMRISKIEYDAMSLLEQL